MRRAHHVPGEPMKRATVISRHDWVHGLVLCPGCGLPLETRRDHGEFLWPASDAKAYGVRGTHERCGAMFEFEFDDTRMRRGGAWR